MTSTLDHVLILGLAVLWPIVATFGYRNFVRDALAGVPGIRFKEYLSTIVVQLAWVAAVLGVWFYLGRSAASIGLTLGSTVQNAIGASLTVAVLFLLVWQWGRIGRLDEARRARLTASLGQAALLLPVTDREQRAFRALAITAGICEELLLRGYLIWYLGAFVGPWPAMVLAAIAFGLAHSYQGTPGVIKTGLVGVVLGTLYLGTGTLLWPMILHAAVDLQGGAVGRIASVTARSKADGSAGAASPAPQLNNASS
jgi:CAAX protease family protein